MSNKILYIGHYREGTGWGQASLDYIAAMDAVGIDLVVRPVIFTGNGEVPERVKELEQRDSLGATHVIQHVLPQYMDYNGQLKNIGLFVSETDSINTTGWPQHLKTMDDIWVPNNEMVGVCRRAGLRAPKVVPHACDPNRFNDVEPLDIAGDDFLFYFVGENIRRKRLAALLQAYYTSFTSHDDVTLLLKTSGEVSRIDDMVKKNLRLYPHESMYAKVAYITDRLTDEDLLRLHKRGDCFVTCTYGDAWCIPAFDAAAMGNWVISSNCGGMRDFLFGYDKGLLVDGHHRPVFGADVIFDDLNTGHENWFEVDLELVGHHMRQLYRIRSNSSDSNNEELIKNYSYEKIGKMILGNLECLN